MPGALSQPQNGAFRFPFVSDGQQLAFANLQYSPICERLEANAQDGIRRLDKRKSFLKQIGLYLLRQIDGFDEIRIILDNIVSKLHPLLLFQQRE